MGDLSQGLCEWNKFIERWVIARPGKIWKVRPLKVRVVVFRGDHMAEHVRAEQTMDRVHGKMVWGVL